MFQDMLQLDVYLQIDITECETGMPVTFKLDNASSHFSTEVCEA
jgi:hypothetical protein